jgi:hypothetical protein
MEEARRWASSGVVGDVERPERHQSTDNCYSARKALGVENGSQSGNNNTTVDRLVLLQLRRLIYRYNDAYQSRRASKPSSELRPAFAEYLAPRRVATPEPVPGWARLGAPTPSTVIKLYQENHLL